jgi:hypothetical protein
MEEKRSWREWRGKLGACEQSQLAEGRDGFGTLAKEPKKKKYKPPPPPPRPPPTPTLPLDGLN